MDTKTSKAPTLRKIKLFHNTTRGIGRVTLAEYAIAWRQWLAKTRLKSLAGLDQFTYQDYTQGTSQSFDMFVLRNITRRTIVTLNGDFQYHRCLGKFGAFRYIKGPGELHEDMALIISAPFSGTGCMYEHFDELMQECTKLKIPVLLDLAYWGIAKNVHIDLNKYPCIEEVTSSLSKPFYTLTNHRVGIRFSRRYLDDGVSMANEVGMQNQFSMDLGVHYMKNFGADWCWEELLDSYQDAITELKLSATDTVIFGIGGREYNDHDRAGVNRVCVSDYLYQE